MKFRGVVAAVAMMASATSAFAGDWTGAYAGISLSAASGTSTWSQSGTTLNSFNDKGILVGIDGGYNWQNGSIVAGIEADYNFGKASVGLVGTNAIGTSSAGNLGSVRGRLGWVATPPLMIYATGGFGWGTTSSSLSSAQLNGGGFTSSKSSAGLVLGAGAEYMIGKNWTLKGEYLRYNLSAVNLSNADTNNNGTLTIQNPLNVFKLGVNYKF